jgi:ubiquinone/menaquinone biosynthesis C-methylase UbiE
VTPGRRPGAPGPFRRNLGYVHWLYNPFQRLDARRVYDLIAASSPTEHGLYLNLGYWGGGAADVDEASDALAMLVARTGRMGPGDVVLDCGYGFGDQDLLWAREVGPRRIIGLNITASQVAVARQRVAEAGLSSRVDLREGSATDMPIPDRSVDLVTALECAFHFRTRERFFREAFRVLRPGGRLVTADILPLPAAPGLADRLKQRLSWGLVASKFAIPPENACSTATYQALLRLAGFAQVEIASIRDRVYAPLHHCLARHPERVRRLHPVARLPARLALRFDPASVYAGLDYVLASAVKPGAGPR